MPIGRSALVTKSRPTITITYHTYIYTHTCEHTHTKYILYINTIELNINVVFRRIEGNRETFFFLFYFLFYFFYFSYFFFVIVVVVFIQHKRELYYVTRNYISSNTHFSIQTKTTNDFHPKELIFKEISNKLSTCY